MQQKKIINVEKETVEELKKQKQGIYRDNNNLSLLLLNKPAEI